MNLEKLQRKARLTGLRLRVGLTWLAFELEPSGSNAKRYLRANYKTAKNELNQALLRDREARMNRRVF